MQLDALGDSLRVAQVAATMGRDFDTETLLQVHRRLEADGEPRIDRVWLEDALVRLSDAGLLVRRRVGGDRLRFRHALLGEAAYESQLLSERMIRHRAVAQVLIGTAAKDSQPGSIARHFREAGLPLDAIVYHLRASDKASAGGEFGEALDQLEQAEALLTKVDDPLPLELSIRMARGAARSASEGLAAVGLEEEFDRCTAICSELGQSGSHKILLADVTAGLWSYYVTRGRIDAAEKLTAKLDDAETAHDPMWAAVVSSSRATELYFCGHWSDARDEFGRSVEAFDRVPLADKAAVTPHDTHAAALAILGPVLAVTGDIDLGHEAIAKAVRRSEQLAFPRGPYSVAFTRIYETWMLRTLGDFEQALLAANEAVQIGAKYGFMDWQLLGQLHVLACEAHLGLRQDGPQQMAPILEYWTQLGAGVGIPLFLLDLVDLHLLAGDLEAADQCLDRAFAIAVNGGTYSEQPAPERLRQNMLLAETHRAKARVLAASGGPESAVRTELESAISVARSQGATLFVLQAQLDSLDLLKGDDAKPSDESLRLTVEQFSPGSSSPQLDRARRLVAT
jgi:tetratricopeptide (TPR) repeat protein